MKQKRKTTGVIAGIGNAVRMAALTLALLFAAAALVVAAECVRAARAADFDAERITGAERSTLVYDAAGELACVLSSGEKRIPIKLDELSETTKYAFISAEDARFYEHSGVDVIRVFGAAWADLKAMRLKEGASTIGQQLVKLSHLSGEKTIERKLTEVFLTLEMEREFTKDEILEMYLNYVYFGGGFYGIEAASLGYFGVHASELTAAQAAQLAGVLKSPSGYAPHLDPEKSLARRNNVLSLMEKYGHLSHEEAESAKAEPCILQNAIPEERSAAVSLALREAADALGVGTDELRRGGYVVRTTLDSAAQSALDELMGTDALFPCENAQGACVLLGRDGAIRALAGSRIKEGKAIDGIDRAADMKRQPGSLIKPVLCYAPALDGFGYTAATLLENAERDFDGYAPRNAGDKYGAPVTLRAAVSESLNIPAVEVLDAIGADKAAAFAKRLGMDLENEHIGLPLALGGFTHGVSPLSMAAAYNAFNNGGEYCQPYCVESIELNGETVYRHESRPARAMREETAFIMSSILRDAAQTGTASALSALGLPLSAKTGTNLDENGRVRDVWCAAFAGELTCVSWMGTDDASRGELPEGTTGGNSACVFLCRLLEKLPRESLSAERETPDGVLCCALDKTALETGKLLLATRHTPREEVLSEYFTAETAPRDVSPAWTEPLPPAQVRWQPDAGGKPTIIFTAADARLLFRVVRVSGDGTERVIAELSGSEGELAYTDHSALPGATYFYYVQTVNPLVPQDGAPAVSEPSRRMRVYVLR